MSEEPEKTAALEDNANFLQHVFSRHVTSSIISMFGAQASGMANTMLAGIFFGGNGLAVMSIAAPFYALFAAIGSLVGVGGSTAAAYALGRDDQDKASGIFALSVFLGIVIPLGMGLICCVGMDFLLPLVGCSTELMPEAERYNIVYFLGGFGTTLFYLPFNFLKLVGKLHLLVSVFLGMAAANALLDIAFVKICGLGIEGIAAGTVASSVGASAVGIFFLLQGQGGFRFSRALAWREAHSLIKLGTPTALNQLLNFLRLLLMNRLIVALAGDVGLAAFSVFSALEKLSMVVLSGLAQATSAFVGVFTKELDTVSVRLIEKRAHILGFILILPLTAVLLLFPEEVVKLFGMYGGEKFQVTVNATYLFAFSLPPSLCCFLMFFYYQAAGFTNLANVLIFCRSFLFLVVPAYLLSPLYGIDAVWASMTVTAMGTLMLMGIFLPFYFRKGYDGILLQNLQAERQGRYISFAVAANPAAIVESVERIGEFCETNGLTPKETMLVRLSMEEMLMSIHDHALAETPQENIDVRILVVKTQDDLMVILRLRNGGKLFNPIDYYERMAEDDPYLLGDALGISMIVNAADAIHYKTTFGINNLTVVIDRRNEK